MTATDGRVHYQTTTTGNGAADHDFATCRGKIPLFATICFLAWPASLTWVIITTVHKSHTPELPDFSLVSVSTTVRHILESKHHVTMDMNVSFRVHNPNKASMAFQGMKALAFQGGDPDVLPGGLSINGATTDDFEQLGARRSTKWFTLHNTTAAIDAWVDSEGESGKSSGKSLGLRFELRGDALYKGKSNWSKQKIPITVACDEVDVLFSSNINNVTSNATRAVAFEPMECHVYGLWGEVRNKIDYATAAGLSVLGVDSLACLMLIVFALIILPVRIEQ
ncbi:hypothetical protein TorRG33x02_021070, partial [Trema orientale]